MVLYWMLLPCMKKPNSIWIFELKHWMNIHKLLGLSSMDTFLIFLNASSTT